MGPPQKLWGLEDGSGRKGEEGGPWNMGRFGSMWISMVFLWGGGGGAGEEKCVNGNEREGHEIYGK